MGRVIAGRRAFKRILHSRKSETIVPWQKLQIWNHLPVTKNSCQSETLFPWPKMQQIISAQGTPYIKKYVFFRALHCPNLLALFPPCPLYLDINIVLCVYLLVIFNTKITKSTKIIITIITLIIFLIIVNCFCNTRWNVVFDVQKKLYNFPELRGGGGNFGNARKNFFL